jgi:tetratricopeptide (TPR) repeat protein
MQRSAQMDSLLHGLVQAMREPDPQHRQHVAQTLIKRIGHEADDQARAGHIDSALSMHMALGAAASGLGAPAEAAQHFLAARDLAAHAGIPGDPRGRGAEGALARCYIAARNFSAAEEVLKSLTSEVPGSGPRGNDTWEPFMDLARVYFQTRRFDEAAAPALRAVEITEGTFDRLHPHFLEALHLLGKVRTEQRQYEEAYNILTETVAGMTQQFGADSPPARTAATDLSEVETVLRNMEKLPQK